MAEADISFVHLGITIENLKIRFLYLVFQLRTMGLLLESVC